MISFLLGPTSSYGRESLLTKLGEAAQTKSVFFVVPEQISLQTEREVQRRFPAAVSRNIMVISFTRLAHFVFKKCGGMSGQYATQISKRIFVELSLEILRDRLEIYRDSIDRPGFGELLLKTVEEAKNAGYTPSDFIELSKTLPFGELRRKTEEFSEIFSVFDSQLKAVYRDSSDDLHRACCCLEQNPLFEGAIFFFDYFTSFYGAQMKLLGNLFLQCDCFFSLCCKRGDSLFATTQRTMRKLSFLAAQQGVPVTKPCYFPAGADKPLALRRFERTILRLDETETFSPDGRVNIILATNEYSEMDEIFSRVHDLVREGYRFSDIMLITRDLNGYRGALEGALKLYQIPYFMDEKRPVAFFPLFRVVEGLLDATMKSEPEALLRLLKSGCTGFSVEEISCFENYLYVWKIGAREIRQPFVQPFRGFLLQGEETNKDRKNREKAERLRSHLIAVIDTLTSVNGTAKDRVEALLTALEKLQVRAVLQDQISIRNQANQIAEAEELARSWELFCEILRQLIVAAGNTMLSFAQFRRLYVAAVSSCEMGELPQTLDAVTIGTANRTLPGTPKIVFVFGVNDGVFPFVPTVTGLFRQADCLELEKYGLSLSPPVEELAEQERLISYLAVTAATERIYLSARLSDVSGSLLQPSEMIVRTLSVFGDEALLPAATQEHFLSLCRTPESARLQLAFHYLDHSVEAATLREYFLEDRDFTERLNRIVHAQQLPFAMNDAFLLNRLFGKKVRLSPSQLDSFYRCPFSYFCRYSLRIRKRERAELSALSLGTIVHAVLEDLMGRTDFMELSREKLREKILLFLSNMLQKRLGGNWNKSARFYQKYCRVGEQLVLLCENIQQEFSVSRFRPEAIELYLGEYTEVPAVEVPFGEDGVATVVGKIDRVDSFQEGNRVYLRVIDYKSGSGKHFSLSELYQGLNLQMLLYLFAICSKPREGAEVIPSGVLYLPATGVLREFCFHRPTSENEREKKISAGFCRNGLILQEQGVLTAMEEIAPGERGKYLPIRFKKDGSIYRESGEFLVSRKQFESLFIFVQKQVSQMCERLLQGEIAARPLSGVGKEKDTTCRYCDYHSICGYSPGNERELIRMNKEEFFDQIGGKEEC